MTKRYFAYYRGNVNVTGIPQKLNAMSIVQEFLKRTAKAKVYQGKNIIMIEMPDTIGDAIWVKENVMREGDIVGIADRPETIQAKADALAAKYESERDGKKYAGTGVLKYWLEHFYLQYDEWGSEDAES